MAVNPPNMMGFGVPPENYMGPGNSILGAPPMVGPGMPPGIMPPGMHPGAPVMMPMPPHPGGPPLEQIPLQLNMNPMMPPMEMHPDPRNMHMPNEHIRPPFLNFDPAAQPMSYVAPVAEFTPAPVMFDQNNRQLPVMLQPPGPKFVAAMRKDKSPQPVPAPPTLSEKFSLPKKQSQQADFVPRKYSPRRKSRSISPINRSPKHQRMRTPEPPIISSSKVKNFVYNSYIFLCIFHILFLKKIVQA